MADKKNKMKVKMESDGTLEGTKVTLNGENITDSENVNRVSFFAHGGTQYRDGDNSPGSVSFSISTLKKDESGMEVSEDKTFSSRDDSFVVGRTPIGKKVNDMLVGKGSAILNAIDEMRDKTKRFIPTRDELLERSWDSVVDLHSDLKKEIND